MAVHLPIRDPFRRTLGGQMWAVAAAVAANALTFYVLAGQKARFDRDEALHGGRTGETPLSLSDRLFGGAREDVLTHLPRVSGVLFLGSAAYLFYVSWLQAEYRRRPALYWVLAANGLVLLAVGVKTGVVFKGGTEAQEEAVEGE